MMNKTFTGGLTVRGASATIDYLLNERVEQGLAYVLEGNVQLTKEIIAQCKNKNKWSSGVLTFSEALPDKTLKEIVKEWKNTFLCGLADEQTAPLFVVHKDKKGRSEIHYVVPRTELSTGKAFNPYFVKRDFKKKDLFQEYINLKYKLSNPIDPKRAQQTKAPIWANLKNKKSVLKEINDFIQPLVQNGSITSRNELIDTLREQGFELAANVQTAKYITITNPIDPSKNGWRLKGELYSQEYFNSDFKANKEIAIQEYSKRDINTVKAQLDSIIAKNTTYNKERYKYEQRENSTTRDNGLQQPTPGRTIPGERIRKLTNQTNTAINSHSRGADSSKTTERVDTHSITNGQRGRQFRTYARKINGKIEQFTEQFKHNFTRSNIKIVTKISLAVKIFLKKKAKEQERTEQSTATKTAPTKTATQTPQTPKKEPRTLTTEEMLAIIEKGKKQPSIAPCEDILDGQKEDNYNPNIHRNDNSQGKGFSR